jgi:error-prone DNA polymerase
MSYAELHCHSYYSFHDGASSLEELMVRAKDLGYRALAVTDHDNLCGAMQFAQLSRSLGLHGITGAEVTLNPAPISFGRTDRTELPQDDSLKNCHLTLLAKDRQGYSNLCRLITAAHASGERNDPALPSKLLPEHAGGLIALSGCPRGELAQLVTKSRLAEAKSLINRYLDWFGTGNYYIELQQNLAFGDTARNIALLKLARETGAKVVATGNVHYHVRERHRLQDCLVAVKNCKSLEETHRERRPNSEYYLRPVAELEFLFRNCPEALENTLDIAERCTMDLTKDLSYIFPDYPTPEGYTPQSYLEELCREAAIRRYGSVTPRVQKRLEEEFQLIKKYSLAGFLLMYHEVIKLGREVMIDLGLSDPSLTLEENPPGRGRGSSVALLAGYLIGLSHIDPLQYDLSLERFLPADTMSSVPDIDLDFPRSIREELILRTHSKWGWRHAALTGTVATYQIKGAVRDLGKALGLPEAEIDHLSKQSDWGSAKKLGKKMERMPGFKDKVDAPVWRDLVSLAAELDGFPKYAGQHPGGMILSSTPLTDIVPVQRGAIEGRYVCQWDKDSIDDAGFVKIDFLALGALSQLQDAIELINKRTGRRIDMSRIDFEDNKVYDMLCSGDTIGIFQVESAAQMQNITRLRPRNLLDMAHEVAAVRPGVGVNHGVQDYLARRMKKKPLTYDCPLEKRALERTLGVVLFQDQVNQLAIDVAGFTPSEADRLRRAFGRKHNDELIEQYHRKFLTGAAEKGVPEEEAEKVFKKFNGQYMFPESHAFAFGVTAYQASWLKYYYPLEFFVAIFNQQPMGFYNLETLKEDAKRHGITVLNPDINKSNAKCTIEPLNCHPEPSRFAQGKLREGSRSGGTHYPPRDSSVAKLPQNDSPAAALTSPPNLLSVDGEEELKGVRFTPLLLSPQKRTKPDPAPSCSVVIKDPYRSTGLTPAGIQAGLTILPSPPRDSSVAKLPQNDNKSVLTYPPDPLPSNREGGGILRGGLRPPLENSSPFSASGGLSFAQRKEEELKGVRSTHHPLPSRERTKVRGITEQTISAANISPSPRIRYGASSDLSPQGRGINRILRCPQNDSPAALRLGLLNVTGLGEASAKAIEEGRAKHGTFKTIGEFLERTGVLEEVALNLAAAGAFDSLESNRRKVKWEIGLRYRPINTQLPLNLPVEQDIVELAAPTVWERMKEEYNVLSLYPSGHIMAKMRPRFNAGFRTSRDIEKLRDGAPVKAAGLIIRRQRPQGKVVFITLEDEFGHIPCMVFPQVYERYEYTFRSAFVIIKGRLTRREGTFNVVINEAESFSALEKVPASKDWR